MSSASSSASAASCDACGDNRGMPYERDVRAFDERAASYESGMLGQLHRDISSRVADLALSLGPAPRRVLDVGAGTGYLLGLLAARLPGAEELTGVDAAPSMVAVARERAADERVRFLPGTAERLPAGDGRYDLVVSTTSFDHWADQAAGIAECARVLAPGGHLVLADQFSLLLWPDAGRRAARQGADQGTRHPAGRGRRPAVTAVAPGARGDHPGGHRGEVSPLADAGDAGDGVAAAGRERALLAGVRVPLPGIDDARRNECEVTEEAREVRDRVVIGLVAARGVSAEALVRRVTVAPAHGKDHVAAGRQRRHVAGD